MLRRRVWGEQACCLIRKRSKQSFGLQWKVNRCESERERKFIESILLCPARSLEVLKHRKTLQFKFNQANLNFLTFWEMKGISDLKKHTVCKQRFFNLNHFKKKENQMNGVIRNPKPSPAKWKQKLKITCIAATIGRRNFFDKEIFRGSPD